MSKEIWISTGFFHRQDTKQLKERLGINSLLCLHQFWCYAAENFPDGILTGVSVEDIENSTEWDSKPGDFVGALLETGFIKKTENGFSVVFGAVHFEMPDQD